MTGNYVVKGNAILEKNKFSETELVRLKDKKGVKDLFKKLKDGSGFQGFTPHFFVGKKTT